MTYEEEPGDPNALIMYGIIAFAGAIACFLLWWFR